MSGAPRIRRQHGMNLASMLIDAPKIFDSFDALLWKRSDFWDVKHTWLRHHDKVRPHSAKLMQQFTEQKDIVSLPHRPYSPDLACCDFWPFPTLKRSLRGQRFESVEQIKSVVHTFFLGLPEEEFEKPLLRKMAGENQSLRREKWSIFWKG